MKNNPRSEHRRIFSEAFKKARVQEFEKKLISVVELSREYQVSRTAIYKWIFKYSTYLEKKIITVVQMESEQGKSKELLKKIAELERALGRKQLEVDFLNKLIEIGKDEFGFDLKKKISSTEPSSGSEKTDKKD